MNTPAHPDHTLQTLRVDDVRAIVGFIFSYFREPYWAGDLPDSVVAAVRRLESVVYPASSGAAVHIAAATAWRNVVDRVVPALEPVPEDDEARAAEWAVWSDRERIRRELLAIAAAPGIDMQRFRPMVQLYQAWSGPHEPQRAEANDVLAYLDMLVRRSTAAGSNEISVHQERQAWMFYFTDDARTPYAYVCIGRAGLEWGVIQWLGDDALNDQGERMAPGIVAELVDAGEFHAEDGACYAKPISATLTIPQVAGARVDLVEAYRCALDSLDEIAHTTERSLVIGAETYSSGGHAKCVRIANEAIDAAIDLPAQLMPASGPESAVAWISDNDLLKLKESVDDARNIRMATTRSHLRVHPVYIPALSEPCGQFLVETDQ